jgi:hypothetical protein
MALALKDVFDAFGYTLSLPERLVKSVATLLVGTTKLLTDTIIPEPLRQTNTYAAIVGNAQRFLIERVAEVQGVYAKEKDAGLPDDFVARKIAGNVMEAAGMFSMHLSPLWVFAIASDVAQGSKVYLNRLVDSLKNQGVLAPQAEIKELNGLFDALGQAGQASAKVFEAPPLSADGLRDLRKQITDGYKGVFTGMTNLLPRMDGLWASAERIATRENVSIESILGLMTVDLGRTAGQAMNAAFAVGQASTELLGETVFRSYAETISRVQEKGAVACLAEATRPYTDALLGHLTGEQTTWTERLWGKVLSSIGAGGKGEPEPEHRQTDA